MDAIMPGVLVFNSMLIVVRFVLWSSVPNTRFSIVEAFVDTSEAKLVNEKVNVIPAVPSIGKQCVLLAFKVIESLYII